MADKSAKKWTAGAIVVLLAGVIGFTADVTSLHAYANEHGWWPSSQDPSADPDDRDEAGNQGESGNQGEADEPRENAEPTATSTKKPRKSPTPKAPEETEAEDEPAAAPTTKKATKATPRPVALSGSSRDTDIVASPDACSMGRCTFLAEKVAIGDKTFTTGWKIECTIGCAADEWVGVNLVLNGQYSRLDATLGIENSTSPDHPLTLELINVATDETLVEKELVFGEAYTLKDFDISGIVKLQIRFTGALGRTCGAVGKPVIWK
ncbi:hypothetical protein FB565_000038 [Actinoplanes lutulentus]|uniref:NPCBM/NEW2 domain-containing protein n=1 Tax=Actinoplanes lutulentus TaxID=1287878 RepID=A0A327Z5B9_9ACTN|nr:hypothetical protein [Actinoplanes lutulentus]MBB2940334.1 hypothetical protein [Actinoplanes lutulentus]RAK28827.1 hypothetical protein B0I29_119165 [Actinoplanes lutulentus]